MQREKQIDRVTEATAVSFTGVKGKRVNHGSDKLLFFLFGKHRTIRERRKQTSEGR